MKITVNYSPLVEYQNMIFNLTEVRRGFFIDQGFFYTEDVPSVLTNYVRIPRWTELQSKLFWEKIDTAAFYISQSHDWYLKCSPDFLPELWHKVTQLPPIDIEFYENEIHAYEYEISYILQSITQVPTSLELYMMNYGTIGSYNIGKSHLILMPINSHKTFLRSVIFGIAAYVIHKAVEEYRTEIYWQEKQRAIDTLIRSTKLGKWYPKEDSVIESNKRSIPIAYREETNEYHRFFGFSPSTYKELHLEGSTLHYLQRSIKLTPQEAQVVSALLGTEHGIVISYDSLAEILWKDKSFAKFSLQSISKTIERINKKAFNVGIHQTLIKNKPKMGYYL